ncbi:receptor activity-modifying protein 2 isoform X1 [Patagioenas fasciata]|uniref:receptor activity-modifying protein 2 isoform X1 n=1 Tax=Patagioenas fasciata TaxID=372321 RepID=UPI003A9959F4
MAPCAQTGSGRLSRGLLLLCALLGTGLCHVGAEAESFGQDARTSPPVAVNWTAQLVEEMYTNITQKCWEFFVDLMRNVTVSELCEWKVISRAPRLCLWATSSRFQGPRATFPSGSSSWCGQWVQDKLLGATRRPPPLLPQLHPAAPGLRPPPGRAAAHDHRPHLPHPLPGHPGHLAQQGRQSPGLVLQRRVAGCPLSRLRREKMGRKRAKNGQWQPCTRELPHASAPGLQGHRLLEQLRRPRELRCPGEGVPGLPARTGSRCAAGGASRPPPGSTAGPGAAD